MCWGQNDSVSQELAKAQAELQALRSEVKALKTDIEQSAATIEALQQHGEQTQELAKKAAKQTEKLSQREAEHNATVSARLTESAESIAQGQEQVKLRSWWGLGIAALIAVALAVSVWLLRRKQEDDSIKLDRKLLELLNRQMLASKQTEKSPTKDIDHSLALKVADEIVRIELNLSRMDTTVKGYKQLTKAVQRIKDNFAANDYEIVDMLGKTYNERTKVIANFCIDESLPEGAQIITGITKPQVNYQGKMIQVAQITVSQNI